MHFLADENFNNRILRGIRRINPTVDIIRVQDTTIYQAPDSEVLQWAAQQGRILLTHDVETMVGFAKQRIAEGLSMPGVIIASSSLSVGQVVDDLLIIIGASSMEEWENRIIFLPY